MELKQFTPLLIVFLLLAPQVTAVDETVAPSPEVIVRQRLLSGNNSKRDLEAYLSERGFSRREGDELIHGVSYDLVREALARNMSKEFIAGGFRDKGFIPDEIDTILKTVAVERTREALLEGIPLEEIQSDLRSKGFTSADINDILTEARSRLPGRGGVSLSLLILSVVAVALLILSIVLVFFLRGRSKRFETLPHEIGLDVGDELLRLQSEKKDVEEMIRIAKRKYHKRTLDEESFREIVRDHQKKLIEIEARISQIEGRVQRLEGNRS
jgi:hypothetical protein